MTQSQANGYIQLYLPILMDVLAAQNVLPFQKVEALKRYLEHYDIKRIYQDGTETEIAHSVDYQTQKEFYGGKKKKLYKIPIDRCIFRYLRFKN